MLTLKNIKKSYTTGDFTQTALDGVSLNFRESEFVAILGPSGSGKTTCLNVIGGLDQYDSGDLIINGKSTKKFKSSEWDAYRNNSIGFVFQNYNLITHLSITANVELGMTLSGVSVSEKHRRALEVLKQVGLEEHVHKKPNQLSGGQMQRVAIARALANDPDIILADEPTGALDTKTSVQIMELIKSIAKDKLVIMVTHNPDLAKEYSDRIVEFKDGKVVSDSNPLEEENAGVSYQIKKTSMHFITALKLSAMNIRTKKWRTFLTAFASSIGIIGIALILSLSNGFNKQINTFESDTLSGFPIMITQQATEMDMETAMQNRMGEHNDFEKFPQISSILPYDPSQYAMVHTNKFTEPYVDYLEKIDSSFLTGLAYTRVVNMNILNSDGKKATPLTTSAVNFSSYPNKLGNNKEGYLEGAYDLLAGSFPSNKEDLILVVNDYNQVEKNVLDALGFDSAAKEIKYTDIIGKEFKVILNNDYYVKTGEYFTLAEKPDDMMNLYNSNKAVTIKISGILRKKEATKFSILGTGLSYSDELSKFFIEDAKDSDIVKAQQKADYNVLTGETFAKADSQSRGMGMGMGMGMGSGGGSTVVTKESMLSSLGASGTPSMITLYPNDFTNKEKVTDYLDKWNDGKSKEDKIIYTDMAATFVQLSGSIMDGITMVLIAFASISLVVSLIMVGIITYISVLERTKEIGVLRALGARKKDISRVFNAETFIVGTCSGLLGIGIAWLLTFPVNSVLLRLTEMKNVASLNPIHAIILVAISVILTMIGGSIPAKVAAKKDPVEALRSE